MKKSNVQPEYNRTTAIILAVLGLAWVGLLIRKNKDWWVWLAGPFACLILLFWLGWVALLGFPMLYISGIAMCAREDL